MIIISWNSYSFGAPKPAVSIYWDTSFITFEITMAKNPSNLNMYHFISLVPYKRNDTVFQTGYNYANSNNSIAIGNCKTTYFVTLPWSSPYVSKTYIQSNMTLQMISTIYPMFVDREIGAVVAFESSQTIYSNLISDAVTVMNTTQNVLVMQYAVRWINLENSKIVVGALLKLSDGYSLSTLSVNSTTTGAQFSSLSVDIKQPV
jgi:hypothetical protein